MSTGLRAWVVVAAVVVLGSGAVGVSGAGLGYNASGVLDASGQFSWFDAPVINNPGALAFTATLDSGVRGLYTLSPTGALTTIAEDTGEFARFLNPVINNHGDVAFYGRLDSGVEGIYLWDGTTIHALATTASGLFAGGSFGGYVALNDNQTVAFGYCPDSFYGIARSIYTRQLGEPTATCIIDSATSEFQSFSEPTINDDGRVAFWAKNDGAGSGIYTHSRLGPLRKVTDTGEFDSFFYSTGSRYPITAGAEVALYGRQKDPWATGLFIGEGDPAHPHSVHTVVDERGPFAQFLIYAMNGWGEVAFQGRQDDGTEGIYVGPAPALALGVDTVIEVGNSFMGTTVTGLSLSPQAINDSGQVAFMYRGSMGIGVAAPAPEPAGLAVLAVVGGLGVGRRRRAKPESRK